MAILRRMPLPELFTAVEELVAGGLAIVEVTVDSEDAFGSIARLRRELEGRALVGAGTLRAPEEAEAAIAAGAEFLVAPTYNEAVVERSLELGVPCVPGALSPTEIDAAWRQGATFVKLFPGAAVGPQFVRALLAPLHEVELVVTGGVDASSAPAFLDAGAVAVGISNAMPARELIRLAAALRTPA